ncbi:hypothetical protein [Oceanidesulfovibrio marinus]|uniref:Uncharacterized protein n=1 Tax=Oceanidesulfovibrio marinus TaxID=370038 RepID=A0A6P1ZKW6_9BACT|nr:hypothetical protein [Oceanidesulfovibrio marinus]QJT07531.1 hypothetical protein E8L03_00740 [Oceanidesulfovibrio marinus]TVM34555.1 hypothetical protein DQK91_08250 [Oceanidesulfovibrio marinus]
MTHLECLEKLEQYIDSGDLAFDFENGEEDRRYEILDVLEKIMDIAEKADPLATKLIFKNSALGALMGMKDDEDDEEDDESPSSRPLS